MTEKEEIITIPHAKIRDRAINIVKKYYEKRKWKVIKKGKPYDLLVKRGNNERYVEVKGTMNSGNIFRALLSKNEKKLMNKCSKNGRHYYLHVVRGIGRDKIVYRYFTKSLISKPQPVGDYYIKVNMNDGKL